MKTKTFCLFTIFILSFTACNKDVDDGDDNDPIIKGKRDFKVGAEGEKLDIKLKSTFWYGWSQRYTVSDTIDIVPLYDTTNTIHRHFDTLKCENLTIWSEGKRLKVDVGPNDLTLGKKFRFTLIRGDRQEGLNIIQEARKE